jgi:hypothetical protein
MMQRYAMTMALLLWACSGDDTNTPPANAAGQAGSAGAGGGVAGGEAGVGGAASGGAASGGAAGSAVTLSSATRDELAESYKELVCSAYQGCCAQVNKSNKPCKEVLGAKIDMASGDYDPALGQRCLDSLAIRTKNIDCSPEFYDYILYVWRFDRLCAAALRGGNPVEDKIGLPGEACQGHIYPMGSSAFCDPGQNLWCPPDTRVCTPTTTDGPCDPDEVGFGCTPPSSCQGGTCKPRRALGEPCDNNRECVPEGACSDGVCAERLDDGTSCAIGSGTHTCKLMCICSDKECKNAVCGSSLCE